MNNHVSRNWLLFRSLSELFSLISGREVERRWRFAELFSNIIGHLATRVTLCETYKTMTTNTAPGKALIAELLEHKRSSAVASWIWNDSFRLPHLRLTICSMHTRECGTPDCHVPRDRAKTRLEARSGDELYLAFAPCERLLWSAQGLPKLCQKPCWPSYSNKNLSRASPNQLVL